MAESLPTFDEYLSGVDTGNGFSAPPPSFDEFLEKPEAYAKDSGASAQPLQSEAQRSYFKDTTPGRIAAAFGHGYMEDVSESKRLGEGQIGLDPETDDWLRKNGAFNDYAKGEVSFSKALFEGVVAKGAVAAQSLFTAGMEAPYAGFQAAAGQIGVETTPAVGRDIALFPEAFPTGFSGMRPHGAIPEPIARAKIEGALDGESVWNGSKEPTAEQRAQRVAAAAEIAPAEALKAEEFGPALPTVHEAARQINPETFREYDALSASRDRFRALLREGAEGKRAEIEASAPHTAEIADLRSKLEDANRRKSKIYEAQLDDLIAKNDAWIASEMEKDTPELSRLRKMVQEMDYRMRDLAPDVSAAYREAEAQMPKVAGEEPPLSSPEQPLAPPEESAPASPETSAVETPKVPEADRLGLPHGIAEDVKRQLIAAARPAEEAEAAAALVEAHYVSRAERFGGRRGTAKEMYEKESPEIRAGREKATREKARVLAKNAPKSDPEGVMASIERKLDTEKLSESQRAELLAEMDRLADAAIKRLGLNAELNQAVFHGSPYHFDKFTLDHIGNGEGAQAYGWGLYFAGKRQIAEFYRESLSKGMYPKTAELEAYFKPGRIVDGYSGKDRVVSFNRVGADDWSVTVERVVQKNGGWVSAPGEKPRAHHTAPTNKQIDAALGKRERGQLYEVEIPEDNVLLHWDKPLSEQPQAVKAALAAASNKTVSDHLSKSLGQEVYAIGEGYFKGDTLARDFYDTLALERSNTRELLGNTVKIKSDEAASKYLNSLGIKGIKYLDGTSRAKGEGSHNYVIFDENAIQTLRTYYQAKRGSIRLATDDAKAAITLMKNADASTFIHETGHHWLDELLKDAAHKFAPSDLIKDAETVREWLKAEKGAEITVRQHEKFARGFERYLMEGVAPSKELAGVFAKFKAWLTEIYKTVQKLRSPISDDIRDVFDRLLTKDPEKTVYAGEYEIPEAIKAEAAAPAIEVPSAVTEAARPPELEPGKPPSGPNERFGKPESNLVDKAGNIRLDNLNTPEDVNQVLRETASENADFIGARRGVISDAQVLDLADALGMDAATVSARKIGETFNAEQIVAARKLLIQSATSVRDAMAKAAHGVDDDVMAYAEAKTRHQMIQEQVSGVTAEAGRALRAFRALDGAEEAQMVGDFLQSATGKTLFQLKQEAQLGLELDTPQKVSKFINDSKKPLFKDMVLEFWINALLSNPVTHVVNTVGNTITALYSIPETALAAGIGKVVGSEGGVAAAEAQARLFGMVQGARDGVIAAAHVFKNDELPPGALTTIEQKKFQAIPSAKIEIAGKEREIGGRQIRIPGRLLTASDQVFQAIAHRQELNALAYRTAAEEGLAGTAFNQRVAEILLNPTDAMMESAKKNAAYQTFTKQLGPVGRSLQQFANSHFLAKLIVPFIRTPANLLKYAGERTPLGVFSAEVRANLSGKNGAAARDTQIARITLGTTIGVASMGLAAQGLITGSGPSDPAQKAALRLTGWQPYSVKIGDTYYSYGRLEPFATIVGVASDMVYAAQQGAKDDDAFTKTSALLFKSLSTNITSKLSLRGVSDIIQAVTDPDRYGNRYVQNMLGTIIPSGIAQVARVGDPTLKETRSAMDALKARIPGLRSTLFPTRDVWGEPIVLEGAVGPDMLSPIYQNRLSHDPVNQRLIALEVYPAKLDRKIRGVELTDAQYDQFSMLSGRLTKQRLDMVIKAQGFAAMPEFIQIKIIKKNIESTRETARSLMMMRNPDILKQALQDRKELLTGKNK